MIRFAFRIATVLFIVAAVCMIALVIGAVAFAKSWSDATPPVVFKDVPFILLETKVQPDDFVSVVSARCAHWDGSYPYVYTFERTLVNLDEPEKSSLRETNLGVSGGKVSRPGCETVIGRTVQIPANQKPGHYRLDYVMIESGKYGKLFQFLVSTEDFEVVPSTGAGR